MSLSIALVDWGWSCRTSKNSLSELSQAQPSFIWRVAGSKPGPMLRLESTPTTGFFVVESVWMSLARSYSSTDSLSIWKNGIIAWPSVEFVPASPK